MNIIPYNLHCICSSYTKFLPHTKLHTFKKFRALFDYIKNQATIESKRNLIGVFCRHKPTKITMQLHNSKETVITKLPWCLNQCGVNMIGGACKTLHHICNVLQVLLLQQQLSEHLQVDNIKKKSIFQMSMVILCVSPKSTYRTQTAQPTRTDWEQTYFPALIVKSDSSLANQRRYWFGFANPPTPSPERERERKGNKFLIHFTSEHDSNYWNIYYLSKVLK